MVVVVFRSRTRPGVDEEMERVGARMYELAAAMPGFVSYKDFQAADGESLALVEFESHESLAAWRDHAEHRAAREAGRARFFAGYHIQVCDVVRDYAFAA